jgi:hypothetical protein
MFKVLAKIGLALGVLIVGATVWHVTIAPRSPVYYKSPEISAVVVDAYTGKPIEGASVYVHWGALRPRGGLFSESSDARDLHVATASTGKDGTFTIPAWGPVGAARAWTFYDWDPAVSVTKPGYKVANKSNRYNQSRVTHDAPYYGTVTLRLPTWAGDRIELERLEGTDLGVATSTLLNTSGEVDSNGLSYYEVSEKMVEGGRLIDTEDFPKVGYIRPTPEVVINSLHSIATNTIHTRLYDQPTGAVEESSTVAVAITLFPDDARRVAELLRKNLGKHDLLLMLGDTPLGKMDSAMSADTPDSVPVPSGPKTMYLPLRKHQDAQLIEHDLRELVRHQ